MVPLLLCTFVAVGLMRWKHYSIVFTLVPPDDHGLALQTGNVKLIYALC